jgi:hypothetical protein
MTSRRILALAPFVTLAIGMVISTAFAASTLQLGWLLGLIVLILSILLADMVKSYLIKGKIALSPAVLVICVVFLAVGCTLKAQGSDRLSALLPQFGILACAVLLPGVRQLFRAEK